MSTKRAMAHLQGLIELDERAETQLSTLAGTLKQVIAQMDAILEDADQLISEVLAEQTSGQEKSFALGHEPVKSGSVKLYLNDKAVSETGYTVANNIVTHVAAVPAGKKLRAEYMVFGLKAQIGELLAGMSDFTVAQFAVKKTKYQKVILWIEANA